MLNLFLLFFKRDYRNNYFSRWIILRVIAVTILNIAIYWFTSRAFEPKFEMAAGGVSDYFTFILIGESGLLIPLMLLTAFGQNIRMCAMNGTIEQLLITRTPFMYSLVLMGFSSTLIYLMQLLLTFGSAYFLFHLDVTIGGIVPALLLQALSLPLFTGLGLLSAATVVYFGRGLGIVVSLSMVISALSGSYFPLSVFPEKIATLISILSPFAILLEETRRLLAEGWGGMASLQYFGILCLWGIIILPIGAIALKQSLRVSRKRGAPLLFTS